MSEELLLVWGNLLLPTPLCRITSSNPISFPLQIVKAVVRKKKESDDLSKKYLEEKEKKMDTTPV